MWYIHTTQHSSAIKWRKELLHTATHINLDECQKHNIGGGKKTSCSRIYTMIPFISNFQKQNCPFLSLVNNKKLLAWQKMGSIQATNEREL